MGKTQAKKLQLRVERIAKLRTVVDDQLAEVGGGMPPPKCLESPPPPTR